jgi:hypothetical protein
VPAETPQRSPVDPMVATEVVVLLHVPPDVASLMVVHWPTHTMGEPLMAAGKGLTVTTMVVVQPAVEV